MAIRKSKKLIKLVEDKEKVSFTYTDRHGETTKRTGMEIHTVGYDKKGHSAIRAFDPKKSEWRLFHNSSIKNFKSDNVQYEGTRAGYNPNDKGMRSIIESTKKVRLKKKK